MAYPTTGLIDDFNRADTGPPPSASWTTSTGLNGLQVASNQCRSSSGVSFGFWNPTTFGPDSECYATIATKPLNTELVAVYVRLQQATSFATIDGYTAFLTPAAGTDAITVQRIDNGTGTALGSTISQEYTAGDGLGMDMVDSTLTVYYKSGASAYAALSTRTDSTYTGAGNIALAIQGTTCRVDDFSGGTRITSFAFPQAFRRILPAINMTLQLLGALLCHVFTP